MGSWVGLCGQCGFAARAHLNTRHWHASSANLVQSTTLTASRSLAARSRSCSGCAGSTTAGAAARSRAGAVADTCHIYNTPNAQSMCASFASH